MHVHTANYSYMQLTQNSRGLHNTNNTAHRMPHKEDKAYGSCTQIFLLACTTPGTPTLADKTAALPHRYPTMPE